jgi:superfamily I DNA and/or RNA helicase
VLLCYGAICIIWRVYCLILFLVVFLQLRRHFVNTGEVSIIKDIVEGCLGMGIDSIMVITPYKQQERMLQLHLHHQQQKDHQQNTQGIRVGTVDKFQGQETQVAIISMVRSNTKQDYHEAIG